MRTPSLRRSGFVVVLRPESDLNEEQATRSLRGLLKTALRQYGLRCVSAVPCDPGENFEPTEKIPKKVLRE